jgi:hypothetical protein
MTDPTAVSAGEAGGIFAGVLALLALLGRGLKWLLDWRAARADAIEAGREGRLKEWQEELDARERRLEEQQAEHQARIEAKLARMEAQQSALLNGYQLIASALRALDPASQALKMADQLLTAAFALDPLTPPDMRAAVERIDESSRGRGQPPAPRRRRRSPAAEPKES